MALVPITHVYDTLSVINNTGLLDGQILYTTDQTVNKIFADVKVNNILRRIEIGGTNTIDTVLDQTSGHAIANSAVAKLAQTVHTNLLNLTYDTSTVNGVVITHNSDNTYTLSGTATGWVTPDICTVDVVEGVSYRLVGCPSGGSGTTYRMGLYTNESSPSAIIQDLGTGRNWVSDRTATLKIRIVIQPNYAISGSLLFKPMLTTDLSATYDDFVQYSGDGELNQNMAELYNNLATTNSRIDTTNTNLTALDTKVGAQSLLPTPSQSVTQNIKNLKTTTDSLATSKQDKLTFDTTPTGGSTNPVTSGGIKTALNLKQDASTAINTSNIAQQSVNYAKGAGSANSATSAGSAGSVPWTGVTGKPVLVEGYSGDGKFWPVHHLGKFTDSNNLLALTSGGNVYWACTAWSDKRLKKNIEDTNVNALAQINGVHLVGFDFKDSKKYGSHKDIGYIAQELKEVIPECVLEVPADDDDKETYGTDTLYIVEDKHLIPYLVKAIQELSTEVADLKSQIEELARQEAEKEAKEETKTQKEE
jgi:hypothetical protein